MGHRSRRFPAASGPLRLPWPTAFVYHEPTTGGDSAPMRRKARSGWRYRINYGAERNGGPLRAAEAGTR